MIKRTLVSQIKIKTYSKKKKESYLNIFQEAKQKNSVLIFFFSCSWSVVVVVLDLDLLFKLNWFNYENKNCSVRRNKERVWDPETNQRRKRKNWRDIRCCNFLMKKNRLLIYSQSDELLFMRNFFFWVLERPLEPFFMISLSIVEIILVLPTLLKMLYKFYL